MGILAFVAAPGGAAPPVVLTLGEPYPPDPAPATATTTQYQSDPGSNNLFNIEIPDPAGVVEWYVIYSEHSPEQGPFAPDHVFGIGGPPGPFRITGRSIMTAGPEVTWEIAWVVAG